MTKFSWLLRTGLLLALLGTLRAQDPLFATETGYDLSFQRNELNQRTLSWRDLARATGGSPPEGLQNCQPAGSYVVYRAGTSFPAEADIGALSALQAKMRRQTVNPSFRFLSQLSTSRIPRTSAGDLAESGRRELQELASRIKVRFQEFFQNPDVDLGRFSFQSTNASKSIDSAVAFVRGLVGLNQICETLSSEGNVTVTCSENSRQSPRIVTPTSAYIPHDPANMDPLLRPYNTRRRCLDTVNKGKTAREVRNFQRSREAMQLKDRVAKRLSVPGAQQLWNITTDEVELLGRICAYYLAMFNENTTWCRLLEYEDLNVAEYRRELEDFWDKSYGFPLNSRVTCPLINDTLEYFDRLSGRAAGAGVRTPLMIFKFADENTLLRLVSLLGIAKDPRPLMFNNYAQSRTRQFRTAKLAPFAGNLALNLFRCEEPQSLFFEDVTFRVQVLLNERPINITFCQDAFCNLRDFRRELMAKAGQCQVQADCNVAFGLNPDGSRPGPGSGGGRGAASTVTPARLLIALAAIIVAKVILVA
ncbi:multiple inositol polyphosphate phosphatase 1-like [Acanthaster planci]|uniref:Multiple inositol polyphosphate phosphatase 1 n=1 Tax=Acanthaster planci TaxID=133434 RepID=A0A8B7Y2M0_ACAPL|nr:multiple inositol polyphosphate phosphatase 1-like [Acanthaster planci]